MASMLSIQIQCSVCLNSLRDPVCLPCQHSFCRVCITHHSAVNENSCPECRGPFSREDIKVNRALRNIVDAARAHLQEQKALAERMEPRQRGQDQCPDHHKSFGFFCKNDQKLACEVCRREERHRGHRFKTLSQAHQSKKTKTSEAFAVLFSENEGLVDLIEKQTDEVTKARVKSRTLSEQISTQFEEMHRFLKNKEEEVKAVLEVEEDKLLEGMELNLFTMEEELSEVKVNKAIVTSALEMDEPCQFLQWWAESGKSLVKKIAPSRTRPSSVEEVRVICESLSLGPRESDLKFSVCTEMLRWIRPAESLPRSVKNLLKN